MNVGPIGHTVIRTNFALSSVAGIKVGDSITVAGVTPSSFDGTCTVIIVSTNIVQTTQCGTAGVGTSGTGGTFTDNTQCRNMRFRKRSVRMRDGYSHTMSYEIDPSTPSVPPFDMTGVEALDVLVNNPQQLVIAFDTNGDLLQETPVGSGTMVPLSPPIPLPTGASMQTAKAYNRIYMAFSNLASALGPPQVIDGPTGVVSPVSQNPIGAIWTPGTYYLPGDVVRTSQNPARWFRCIVAGTAGNVEPTWPTLDGYLAPEALVANIINVSTVNIGTVGHPVLVTNFVLSSVAGISVGDAITIAGVTPGSFDGAVTVTIVSTNIIQTTRAGTSNTGDNGAGGTFTDNSQTTYSGVPAEVTDPNGTMQLGGVDAERRPVRSPTRSARVGD